MDNVLPATIENMRLFAERRNLVAFSYITGEEYSANPNDYWNALPGWTMHDSAGEPMILVVRTLQYLPVEA